MHVRTLPQIRSCLYPGENKNPFSHQGPRPRLAIVQVGDRSDSNVYINMKRKAGDEIGVAVDHVRIPRTVTEGELMQRIDALNADLGVDGIIVQMPLDCDAK